jgi:hypothetical protein
MKTEIAKRKLVEKFCMNVFFSPNGNVDADGRIDERYFFAAPTRDQAKDVAWDDLRAMIPKELVKTINYSKLYIEHICGPRLYVLGVDKPQRMEGHPWNWGVFTEFPDMKEGAWEANFRPLFADRHGGCIIEGRPDFDKPNNDKFEELFQLGLSKKNGEWRSFNWHSKEVLDDEELEEARRTMSEALFDQEFGGSFVTAPGRAYPEFVRSEHVREDITNYDPSLPVIVGCDFNAEHHNWGIYQVDKARIYKAIDEVYVQNGTVETMIVTLKEQLDRYCIEKSKLLNRPATHRDLNLIFTGDFSGTQHRPEATYTAWEQIESAFKERVQGKPFPVPIAEFIYMVQPPISDRLNMVRAALKNSLKEIHFYVSPRCPNLIRDFEKVTRKMVFSGAKSGLLTHSSDNAGYMIDQTGDDFKRKNLFKR